MGFQAPHFCTWIHHHYADDDDDNIHDDIDDDIDDDDGDDSDLECEAALDSPSSGQDLNEKVKIFWGMLLLRK